MKRNSTKICIALTIIWTIIIFSFSLQPADTSSQLSSGFGRWLIEVFAPYFIDEFESMPEEQLAYIHFLLRKCAHFTEYFILGVLVLLSQRHTGIRRKVFNGLVICMLVASVDETIQLFVSGRSGQISDVLLDTAGAAVGNLVKSTSGILSKEIISRKGQSMKTFIKQHKFLTSIITIFTLIFLILAFAIFFIFVKLSKLNYHDGTISKEQQAFLGREQTTIETTISEYYDIIFE